MHKEDTDTRFKKGNPGGPGRKPGSVGGRRLILQELDRVLAQEGNVEKFSNACQDEFNKDPLAFWYKYGMPLLPQGFVLGTTEDVEIIVKMLDADH